MKRLMVIAAGSIALMSGAAYAGEGGCSYGKHLAAESAQTPVMAEVDAAEAKRLELLAKMQKEEALIVGPVIHN